MPVVSVPIKGSSTQIDFTGAVLRLTGEFSGNIDLSVNSNGPLSTSAVLKNLRLRMPGSTQLVEVAGHLTTASGVDVTIYSELMPPGKDIPSDKAPDSVEIFWLEAGADSPVARLPIRTEDE